MSIIRFIIRFILLIFAVSLILPIVILTIAIAQKQKNRKLNKRTLNFWSRLLCRICGLKVVTSGKIHKNPIFIVANHISWLDIPVIHSYKLVGFVAKEEISRWPILGWIVKSGETLFMVRGKQESRKKVLELIDFRLNNGRSIAVFPEGKVTDGSYVSRFHRQLMQAAIETKTPIQAIAIKYKKKNGERNKNVAFLDDESFVKNVFRILSIPSSIVELNFCTPIKTNDISARTAANITFEQVKEQVNEDT